MKIIDAGKINSLFLHVLLVLLFIPCVVICEYIRYGSSTLVQSFKKVKNFKSPLFIDDLKFFCCQVLKFYVACVVCVAPLLYNILEVFDHETLV